MVPWLKRSSYLIDNITKKKFNQNKKKKTKNKNLMTNESCRNVDIYLEDVDTHFRDTFSTSPT